MKKRMIALLVVTILCIGLLPSPAFAGVDPSTCKHPNLKTSTITPGATGFPNGGTILYCPDCNYQRQIPNSGLISDSATKSNKPACTHSYGYNYRNEGDQHLILCSKCGKWLSHRPHESKGMSYDDNQHWKVCRDCNAVFDRQKHTTYKSQGMIRCRCGWHQAIALPELEDEIPEALTLGEPGPEQEEKSEPEKPAEAEKPSEETVVIVQASPAPPAAAPTPSATRYTAPPRAKASPKPAASPDPACTHAGSIRFHFDKDYHWVECGKCGKQFEVYQAHSIKYINSSESKYELYVCTVCGFHYYRHKDTGEWLIRDYGWWDRSADPEIPFAPTPLNEMPDGEDLSDYFNDPFARQDKNAQEFYNNLDALKQEAREQLRDKKNEEAERVKLDQQARKDFEQRKLEAEKKQQEAARAVAILVRLRQKAEENGVNLNNLSEYREWMEKNYEAVETEVDREIAEKKAEEQKAAEQAKQPAAESGGQPAPAASPGPGPGPNPGPGGGDPGPGPGPNPGPGGGDPGPGGGDPGPGGGNPGPGGGNPGPGGGDPGPGGGNPGPGGGDPGPGGGDPGPGGGNPGPGGGNPGPGSGPNPGPGGGGGLVIIQPSPGPASTPPPPQEDNHEHIFGLPIKSGETTHTRWCITCGRVGQSEKHRFLDRGEVEPSEKYPNGGTIYQCPLCGYGYVEAH